VVSNVSQTISIPTHLYHGTSAKYVGAIQTQIRLDVSKLPCDFGPGFYTSTQKKWAMGRAILNYPDPVVIIFQVNQVVWKQADTLIFQTPIKPFWDFVKKCDKIGDYRSSIRHTSSGYHDVVYGQMVNRVQLLLGNEVTFDPADSGFQISFHTRLVDQILTFDSIESP
jgi:hypothetical protein